MVYLAAHLLHADDGVVGAHDAPHQLLQALSLQALRNWLPLLSHAQHEGNAALVRPHRRRPHIAAVSCEQLGDLGQQAWAVGPSQVKDGCLYAVVVVGFVSVDQQVLVLLQVHIQHLLDALDNLWVSDFLAIGQRQVEHIYKPPSV